jgi:hypothetical protein
VATLSAVRLLSLCNSGPDNFRRYHLILALALARISLPIAVFDLIIIHITHKRVGNLSGPTISFRLNTC